LSEVNPLALRHTDLGRRLRLPLQPPDLGSRRLGGKFRVHLPNLRLGDNAACDRGGVQGRQVSFAQPRAASPAWWQEDDGEVPSGVLRAAEPEVARKPAGLRSVPDAGFIRAAAG